MTGVDPATVDPAGLADAMRKAGFTDRGGQPGRYVRMQWPPGTQHGWLLVPLDRSAPDFPDLMDAMLGELAVVAAAGRPASAVLATVKAADRP